MALAISHGYIVSSWKDLALGIVFDAYVSHISLGSNLMYSI
jgi:hypothetical protein